MRLLIASPIDQGAMEKLEGQHNVVTAFKTSREELKRLVRDREAFIFRSGIQIDAELMSLAPELKLLIRAGSGVDNLDLDYANQHGIQLVRIPEPGAKAVAEMTFALMLALSRNLIAANASMQQAKWEKYQMVGYLLNGKTLGLIGAGNIGARVGRMAAAWGMEVIAYDTEPSPEFLRQRAAEQIRLTSFEEVIRSADYVSIHTPLGESTRYLFDREVIARMKPGAFLINIARGGVVDEKALLESLTHGGPLRGAALDVHEQEGEGKLSPLAGLPNVILTPHIGASTFDSQREIGYQIVEAVNSFEKDLRIGKLR